MRSATGWCFPRQWITLVDLANVHAVGRRNNGSRAHVVRRREYFQWLRNPPPTRVNLCGLGPWPQSMQFYLFKNTRTEKPSRHERWLLNYCTTHHHHHHRSHSVPTERIFLEEEVAAKFSRNVARMKNPFEALNSEFIQFLNLNTQSTNIETRQHIPSIRRRLSHARLLPKFARDWLDVHIYVGSVARASTEIDVNECEGWTNVHSL